MKIYIYHMMFKKAVGMKGQPESKRWEDIVRFDLINGICWQKYNRISPALSFKTRLELVIIHFHTSGH